MRGPRRLKCTSWRLLRATPNLQAPLGHPSGHPERNDFGNLAVEARPLLDIGESPLNYLSLVLSSPTLILPKLAGHPQYTKTGTTIGQRKALGKIRRETIGCGGRKLDSESDL